MRPFRLIIAVVALGFLAQPAVAFQETKGTEGGTGSDAATQQKPTVEPGKGLNLSVPGKPAGTEVRIPGIGTIGVLPKLDFGLELLYGANETKVLPEEKNDTNDVQIRGTIKHRF